MALAAGVAGSLFVHHDAATRYQRLQSGIIYDRHSNIIEVQANAKGHYVLPTTVIPTTLSESLIAKEDRWFYYHPGVNPISILKAAIDTLSGHPRGGSTLTQQLAKQLLEHELDRSFTHRFILYKIPRGASLEMKEIHSHLVVSAKNLLLAFADTRT